MKIKNNNRTIYYNLPYFRKKKIISTKLDFINNKKQSYSLNKINKIKTYRDIDELTYKNKLISIKRNKLKKSILYKNISHIFKNNEEDKIETNKEKKLNHNNIYLNENYNIDIVKNIILNKLIKEFNKIININNKNDFNYSLNLLEKYISKKDSYFFEKIRKNMKYDNLKFKDNFLDKIKNNIMLETIINILQNSILYLKNIILKNFKFQNIINIILSINFKSIFYYIYDYYKNNTILYLKNNNLKIFNLIDLYKNKIKQLEQLYKENEINNLKIIKNDKVILNPYHEYSDIIFSKKKLELKKFKIKEIQSRNFDNDKLYKIIKFNKVLIKELNVDIKLDKAILKEKILFNIYNKNIFEDGIIFYISSLKLLDIEVIYEEIKKIFKDLNIIFVKKIFEILNNLKYNEKKIIKNNSLLKDKFQKVLGIDNKIKIEDLKKKLIKNYIFKNNTKINKVNINLEKNKHNFFIKNLNDLFIIEIDRILININNSKDKIIDSLSLYFGIESSTEIYNKYINDKNKNFYNFTFFKKIINFN